MGGAAGSPVGNTVNPVRFPGNFPDLGFRGWNDSDPKGDGPPDGADRRTGEAEGRVRRPRRHPEKKQEGKGKLGSLDEPGGLRGRPGPRDPDHRARVRRLRHRGRQVPRRPDAGGRVHRLPAQAGRLRPAPAQRPDDPRQAAARRGHPRPDGRVRRRVETGRPSTRATSRRARTSRSTTSRSPTRRSSIREISDAGLSSREGCGNTVRNVTGDPRAGIAPASSSTSPHTAAPTCAISSATRRPS